MRPTMLSPPDGEGEHLPFCRPMGRSGLAGPRSVRVPANTPEDFDPRGLDTMLHRLLTALDRVAPAPAVSAHCDGPCGVYDPASARIAAESVVAMTKKILDLDMSTGIEAHNTFSRFVAIKEEQAELTKHELSILWHDYFKPNHLEAAPDLHDIVWNAIKADALGHIRTGRKGQHHTEPDEKEERRHEPAVHSPEPLGQRALVIAVVHQAFSSWAGASA